MKKKTSSKGGETNLPVSKQTAGGVTGAVIGAAIAGPVGAVVGGVAGTMMGKRSAEGKTLLPSSTMKAAKKAVASVKKQLPSVKIGALISKSPKPKAAGKTTKPKAVAKTTKPKSSPAKPVGKPAASKAAPAKAKPKRK